MHDAKAFEKQNVDLEGIYVAGTPRRINTLTLMLQLLFI